MTHAPDGRPALALNEPQGRAPGGTTAYCNHDHEAFSGVRNWAGRAGLYTGYQWQCVEYSRRWLWDRKGLLLPDLHIAAQIFHVPHVFDAAMTPVPVITHRNGGEVKPTPDSLIIYAPHPGNFPGHVGVITEVGEDYIRVADQNRFFHRWAGPYAEQFPLSRDHYGRWRIEDKEEPVMGWVTFPGCPNLDPVEAAATHKDDHGTTHAAPQRPFPDSVTGVPEFTDGEQRKIFFRAMLEFNPHYVVFPYYLARIFFFMWRHQATTALKTWWNGGSSSKAKRVGGLNDQ